MEEKKKERNDQQGDTCSDELLRHTEAISLPFSREERQIVTRIRVKRGAIKVSWVYMK